MSDIPEVLHESEGLRIVRNPRNGFVIGTLFYYADPAKRDPSWVREAQQGMTESQFAREVLIDYSAMLGAKVFPEITNRRQEIILAPFEVSSPRYWAGFDYGSRNPSSFHVYTIIDGITYSIWELFEPCKNVPEFVEKMKACPYWSMLKYIVSDPSCWAPTQQQAHGQPISIHDLFWREGVRNMLKGRNDPQAEDAWVAMMRQAWTAEEPTFKIFDICHNQIREFETAIYSNQSERQLMTSVYKETIADKDNHSLDDCKYFMLSRPNPKSVAQDWSIPTQGLKWVQGGGKSQQRKAPAQVNPYLSVRGYR